MEYKYFYCYKLIDIWNHKRDFKGYHKETTAKHLFYFVIEIFGTTEDTTEDTTRDTHSINKEIKNLRIRRKRAMVFSYNSINK